MRKLKYVYLCLIDIVGFTVCAAQPDGQHQQPLFSPPTLNNINSTLFSKIEELAKIVDITYCVGTPATGIQEPFSCLSYCSSFPSFQLVKTWNTGPLLSDSCGYIALSHPPAHKRIIVAFRGTYSITNAVVDLSTGQQEYVPYPPSDGKMPSPGNECMGCMAHKGFLDSWKVTADVVVPIIEDLMETWGQQGYELELVGHSLGGAVAALAALEFTERRWKPRVTTFGEPRVGNLPLANYFNFHFTPETYRRVTHVDDPVPLLPFQTWGFIQHETEFFIEKKDLPITPRDIRICEGNEDPTCAASSSLNVFKIFWSHRDYFHRMGLCVPS